MKIRRQDVVSAVLMIGAAPSLCMISDHSTEQAPLWSLVFALALLVHTAWRYGVDRDRVLRRVEARRYREDKEILKALDEARNRR